LQFIKIQVGADCGPTNTCLEQSVYKNRCKYAFYGTSHTKKDLTE